MGISKKIVAVILSVLMAAGSFAFTANAAESNAEKSRFTYISDDGDAYAKKVTHVDSNVKTNDGIVDYLGNGVVTDTPTDTTQGDRSQNYSWSSEGYGDYVYIGTCANAMTSTLSLMGTALGDKFDQEIMEAALNTMFNGNFYQGEEDGGNPAGILVKLNTKTGELKLLMSKATTGTNVGFRNSTQYNGNIYFCGSVNGIPSIYKVDPQTDECKCVYQSMTMQEYYQAYLKGICVGIRGMCVYNNQLIVSLNGLEGAYICSTTNPDDPSSFKVIADMDDLFNYPAYHYCDSIYGGSVWDMVEYNNSLYVSLCTGTPQNMPDDNTMQSFALVRADEDSNGNWNWTAVAGDREKDNAKYTFGIDAERTRSGAANLMTFGDYLYIGEYNDEEIALEDILFRQNCDFVNANLSQSVGLYRMDKNEDVELVVGDADTMFPDGSLTGYGSGFGKNSNQYIWRMQVYNNKLFVGTFDTSSLLEPIGQFTNGDLLNMSKEEWSSQLEYINTLLDLIINKNNDTAQQAVLSDDFTTVQMNDAVKIINNRTANKITNNKNLQNTLAEINALLEKLQSQLDDNVSEEFLENYQKVIDLVKQAAGDSDVVNSIYSGLITEQGLKNIKSVLSCAATLATQERGFDLYAIDEDMNVETITTNGFGDPYNHGLRVFSLVDSGLYIGTANPFYGTQGWVYKELGDYVLGDVNKDGILDINDATRIQRVLANQEILDGYVKIVGDMSKRGYIDINDATEISRILSES